MGSQGMDLDEGCSWEGPESVFSLRSVGGVESDGDFFAHGSGPLPLAADHLKKRPGSPRSASLSSSFSWKVTHPAGPGSLDEVLDWAPSYLQRISNCHPEMYHRVVNKLVPGDIDNDDQPLLIWTDYSGIGGAELATLEVLGAIQARAPEGQQPRVQFHRSREIQEDCRKVLLAEMPPSGPCHVFGDIFECVPASARCKLEKSKRAMERKFNKTAAEGKPPQQIVRDLGESFCADLDTIIKSVRLCPGRQQFCYRCQKNCPVAWPHGKRSAGQRALAIAGVTCVDYSSFGKRRAMTGDSMLCQAAWVMQMMADQPDLIIVECVVMFMLRTLKVLEDMYEVASLPFSPVDLGVPSSRPRRYTLLRHRAKTRGFMDLAHDFSNIFFRSLRVDCSV